MLSSLTRVRSWLLLSCSLSCSLSSLVCVACSSDDPHIGMLGDAGHDSAIDAMRPDGHVNEDDANVADADLPDANSVDAQANVDAASCAPIVDTFASLGGAHVASNDGVTYNSNPPSSGPHCGTWGQYAIYGAAKPLPRCNYIHNLEHGAVVVLYKCDGACPDVVAALTQVRDAIVDPECPAGKRVILTPDANIDTPIAATAWTTTWTSACVNAAAMQSLSAFISDNLGGAGVAPESGICQGGGFAP